MEDSELVNVTVPVPRPRLGEFYAWFGEWSSQPGTPSLPTPRPDFFAAGRASSSGSASANGATAIGWQKGDEAVAAEVVKAGNDNARAIYRVLAEHAGEPVLFDKLDEAVGMSGLQRVGVLGGIGRTCRARKRVVPWDWDSANGTYTMPSEVAPLFKKALANHGDPGTRP